MIISCEPKKNYQIPNLKESITRKLRKRKYIAGIAIFNLGLRKIENENFPPLIVEAFSPGQRSKQELIEDPNDFIRKVNALEEIRTSNSKDPKQCHPFFGDIDTLE